ncbi:MAG: hypothetical protein ACPG5T_07130, partial [Endozoicomonas sp.]
MKQSTATIGKHTANTPKPVSAEVIKAKVGYHALYVGLDTHKDTIAVAVAKPGRQEPEYRGEIANSPKTLDKLLN